MRRSVMSFICVGLSLFYFSAGEAADWLFMGKSKNGNISGFIDKKSIRPVSNNIIITSIKLEYYRGKTLKLRKTVSHTVGDEEINCSVRQTKTLQYTVYFTDGDSSPASPSYWQFVIPESILNNIYDYVCTNGKK